MPIKPDNITDAEWNAMDEVTRMRAANQELALTQAMEELFATLNTTIATLESQT